MSGQFLSSPHIGETIGTLALRSLLKTGSWNWLFWVQNRSLRYEPLPIDARLQLDLPSVDLRHSQQKNLYVQALRSPRVRQDFAIVSPILPTASLLRSLRSSLPSAPANSRLQPAPLMLRLHRSLFQSPTAVRHLVAIPCLFSHHHFDE